MLTKIVPTVPVYYACCSCHYKTSRKSQYDRHLSTDKHKMLTDVDAMLTNIDATKKSNICDCGKLFKFRQSLHVHKKKCHLENTYVAKKHNANNSNEPSDKELIMMVIKQNTELIKENSDLKNMMLIETSTCKTMMMEQSKLLMKVIETGTHNTTNNTTHTNSHNKSFNLHFFLNETCKDAMNIMDFVDSIKLQLSDLEKVGEIGYVEGISNIIVKNLNELDVTQRPVHCTDKKRETMYIKDEDKWEKDEENSKIKKAIKRVASKNQRLITKFKEEHPDCTKYHSRYSDQYNKIIVESMGGSGNNDAEKEEKIIRNISKNVVVDK
jgi:hypothetical protein